MSWGEPLYFRDIGTSHKNLETKFLLSITLLLKDYSEKLESWCFCNNSCQIFLSLYTLKNYWRCPKNLLLYGSFILLFTILEIKAKKFTFLFNFKMQWSLYILKISNIFFKDNNYIFQNKLLRTVALFVIFANLVSVWPKRKQLGSHNCFCSQYTVIHYFGWNIRRKSGLMGIRKLERGGYEASKNGSRDTQGSKSYTFENHSSRKYKALFHPVLREHNNLGTPVSLFKNDNETSFFQENMKAHPQSTALLEEPL